MLALTLKVLYPVSNDWFLYLKNLEFKHIFQNDMKIFSNYGNGVSDISIFESVAKNYIELQKDALSK